MRLLQLDEIKEGMILGEDIVGNYDILFLSKGTVLTEKNILGLGKLDLHQIYILESVDDQDNQLSSKKVIQYKQFNKEYHKAVDAYKSIFQNFSMGNPVQIQEVHETISPLIQEIMKDNNILAKLRNVEFKDEYTYKHSINVCTLSTMIGKWLDFSSEQLNLLATSALFHDIGKSKVPLDILNKPTKLTEQEFEIMKKHSVYGYESMKTFPNIHQDILYGILQHHERMDGSGYPLGLKGDRIHIFAKIIAVADIFDAMTSQRIYKEKESPFKVADILQDNKFCTLDPFICQLFLKNITEFYVGNIVQLNTGEFGEIVMINKAAPTKPLIKLGDHFLDLTKETNYEVVQVL